MTPTKSTIGDFVVTNVVHVAISVILLSQVPLFVITVSDPVAAQVYNLDRSLKVECYSFYARSVGYQGQTTCTDSTFGESCWNIIERMNTATCGINNTHVSVSPIFETYSFLAPVFMLLVVIFCAVGPFLISLTLVDYFRSYWEIFISVSFFMFFVAGAMSVGLVVVTAHIVDKASHQGNNGMGQHVFISAGTWVGITLPLISLILGGTVSRWKTNKLD